MRERSRPFASGIPCDQTCTSREGQIAPEPVRTDRDPIAMSGKKPDVNDTPHQPSEMARNLELSEIGNGSIAANGG